MTFWQFRACLDGYTSRYLDQQTLSVFTGYWAAYYSNKKHAKKPQDIIEKLLQSKERKTAKAPDVEQYLRLEAQRLKAQRSEQDAGQ